MNELTPEEKAIAERISCQRCGDIKPPEESYVLCQVCLETTDEEFLRELSERLKGVVGHVEYYFRQQKQEIPPCIRNRIRSVRRFEEKHLE